LDACDRRRAALRREPDRPWLIPAALNSASFTSHIPFSPYPREFWRFFSDDLLQPSVRGGFDLFYIGCIEQASKAATADEIPSPRTARPKNRTSGRGFCSSFT
jgi:hypothetical protein